MMFIAAIALVIASLAWKIIRDYRLFLKRLSVNHRKEWAILVVLNVPSIVIFTMESALVWYVAAALSGIMIALFIWLFFDGIYNLLRRQKFFFTGSDDPDDAWADNFLQAIPTWLHIAIKVGGSAVTIIVYVFNLKT